MLRNRTSNAIITYCRPMSMRNDTRGGGGSGMTEQTYSGSNPQYFMRIALQRREEKRGERKWHTQRDANPMVRCIQASNLKLLSLHEWWRNKSAPNLIMTIKENWCRNCAPIREVILAASEFRYTSSCRGDMGGRVLLFGGRCVNRVKTHEPRMVTQQEGNIWT